MRQSYFQATENVIFLFTHFLNVVFLFQIFLNWFNNMTILTLYVFFHSLLSSKKIIIFHLLNLRQRNYKKSVCKIWISIIYSGMKGLSQKQLKFKLIASVIKTVSYQNWIKISLNVSGFVRSKSFFSLDSPRDGQTWHF